MVSSGAAQAGGAEPLLTVREVAARLSVATSTVYTLCADGRLRHLRVANAIRVSPADVTEYLARASEAVQRGGGR